MLTVGIVYSLVALPLSFLAPTPPYGGWTRIATEEYTGVTIGTECSIVVR